MTIWRASLEAVHFPMGQLILPHRWLLLPPAKPTRPVLLSGIPSRQWGISLYSLSGYLYLYLNNNNNHNDIHNDNREADAIIQTLKSSSNSNPSSSYSSFNLESDTPPRPTNEQMEVIVIEVKNKATNNNLKFRMFKVNIDTLSLSNNIDILFVFSRRLS